MERHRNHFFLLRIILIASMCYGIVVYEYKIFPYKYIKKMVDLIRCARKNSDIWSVGIYEGTTPFDLADPVNILNPVITAKDVDDTNAIFVADPFMLLKNGKYYMFFEVMNRKTNQGDIGYAKSTDGRKWKYKKIIIDEEFHLSYPYVFEWDNNYYLIPESGQDLSVRLYKATSFPEKWQYVGNLLSGYRYLDPSIFRYEDKWWMFVYEKNSVLNLYYSKHLSTGWMSHPMNPIVKLNKHISRPGGRVIVYNHKLYRFTQDDYPSYGIQVFAFEITKLSEKSYKEKMVSRVPILTKAGNGWNAAGMHHVDLHKVGDKWIAAVDGRK